MSAEDELLAPARTVLLVDPPGGERDPAGCWLAPEAAGLRFVGDVYIADAARRHGPRRSPA